MNMLGLLPKLRDLTEPEIAHISYWVASCGRSKPAFDSSKVRLLTDLAFYDCSVLLKMAEHYFRVYETEYEASFSRAVYNRIKKLVEECSGNA